MNRRTLLIGGAGLAAAGAAGSLAPLVTRASGADLQSALDAAQDHEIIIVPAGDYPAPASPYVYPAGKCGVGVVCPDGEAIFRASLNGEEAWQVFGDGLRLEGIALAGTPDQRAGLSIYGRATVVRRCRFDGFSRAGLGYGVLLRHGARDSYLADCSSRGCRHAYSSEAGTGVDGAIFQRWSIFDTLDDGFDAHWGGRNIHHWGHTVVNPGNHGGMVQDSAFTVRDITVVNPKKYDLVIQPLGGECLGLVSGLNGSSPVLGLFVEFKHDATWPHITTAGVALVGNSARGPRAFVFDDERAARTTTAAVIPETVLV